MQLKPLVLVEENCFKSAYCLNAFCNFIKVPPREKGGLLKAAGTYWCSGYITFEEHYFKQTDFRCWQSLKYQTEVICL